jgi:6-phosphogluconate dehydrogenase
MQLGMIGLGRMGANMVRRLLGRGHACVVYDRDPGKARELADEGVVAAASLAELAGKLAPPRAVWIMVPAGAVESTLLALRPHLGRGDVVIDGGNSHWPDAIRRAADLEGSGIAWLDVGTSGGVFGLENGYCLMIGGEAEAAARLGPIFDALAPGVEAAPRTQGRSGPPVPAERGWLHCGPAGAGHFVKMVHNGIEYGLMAAYAEGLNLLRHADVGLAEKATDAETAPLAHPERYRYQLDLREIAELWRRGSVVRSWLLDLTAQSLVDDPALEGFSGSVSDSGEGRWTVQAAVDTGVPAPVLSAALFDRFASRGRVLYAHRVLSALRLAFGGHAERKE